ncbi:uncharacterized protein LOC126903886 [Daktulosphaira vitifoliae]|uniref:uncharacterized protein LOC126903886 n=1 Tax=Daktulosphaira vitifoliae TaxID=58002 RepID=UPI0021AADD38|nr:uncharacterized protein LOC126903886 [Daktulosphaira vitifoliae]
MAVNNMVRLIVVLCATIVGIYALPPSYSAGHYDHYAPATSYATISTTHVKVHHPPATPQKYETPYKYEYLDKPLIQPEYKYISLPAAPAFAGKLEDANSTPGYKYLAASPTYKYVQPPAVNSEPEEEEDGQTEALKYAYKYENLYKEPLQKIPQTYEQPAVQYKYITVPSYKYIQQQQPEYDFGTEDKHQY